MSYGSAAGVGGLSALWSDSGVFSVSTTPTKAQVETWLDEVSSVLDSALADEGFTTPISVPTIIKELDLLCNGITKDLVDYSHSSGRFFSERALETGASPFMTIDKELHAWVQRKSVGFELQGAEKVGTGRKVATFDLL